MDLPEIKQHDRPPREAVAERLHAPADNLARHNQLESAEDSTRFRSVSPTNSSSR